MTPPGSWIIGTRELRRAAKSGNLWLRRTGFVFFALVLLAGMVLWQDLQTGPAGALGAEVFRIAVGWTFLMALISGPAIAADLVSTERRDGTLDLLRLAGVRPAGVVLGKLGYAATEVFPVILSMAPLLVLPVLVGGVVAEEVVHALTGLFLTAGWSLAVSLFFSALCRNGRVATGLALIVLVGVAAGCRWGMERSGGGLAFWPLLSPAESLVLTVAAPNGSTVHSAAGLAAGQFIGLVAVLGLACAAAELLGHPWLRAVPEKFPLRSRRSPNASRRAVGWKRTLLEREPLAWLILRERFSGGALIGVVGLAALVWGASLLLHTAYWADSPAAILMAACVLMGLVKVWLALDTTRRLSEDRESGALQIILTTGMPPDEVLRGLERGLYRRYLLPVLVVACLSVGGIAMMVVSGEGGVEILLLLIAALMFVFDAFAILWTGLYEGLVRRNAARALVATVLKALLLPWLVLGPMVAALALSVGPRVDLLFLTGACWFTVGFLTNGILVAFSGPGLADRLHHCSIGLEEPPVSLWQRLVGFAPADAPPSPVTTP